MPWPPADGGDRLGSHLYGDILAGGERLGEALIDVVAEKLPGHENLAETRNRGRHGSPEFRVATEPVIEIVGIAERHREIADTAIEDRRRARRRQRLTAVDRRIRIEKLQMKRCPHRLHQGNCAHHAGKATADDRDPRYGRTRGSRIEFRGKKTLNRHLNSLAGCARIVSRSRFQRRNTGSCVD